MIIVILLHINYYYYYYASRRRTLTTSPGCLYNILCIIIKYLLPLRQRVRCGVN